MRKHLSAIKGGWLAAATAAPALDARDLRRRRRRPERHRIGPDGRRSSTFADALDGARSLRRPRRLPAAGRGASRARRARRAARDAEAGDPRLAGDARVIGSRARRDGGRRGGGARRADTRCTSVDDPVVGEARTAARGAPGGRCGGRRAASRCASIRAARRPCTSRAAAGAGATRNSRSRPSTLLTRSRAPRRSPASAPTASTGRPTRPARSSIPRRSTRARAGRAVARRDFLDDNDAYAFFARARRPHPHRADRHQRRRPPGNSVSLNFTCCHAIRSSRRCASGCTIPPASASCSSCSRCRATSAPTFKRHIKSLVASGDLIQIRGQRFGLPEKMDLYVGRLQTHPAGYGFVIPERPLDGGGDIYISRPAPERGDARRPRRRAHRADQGRRPRRRAGSSASSSAATRGSSAATTATRTAWATSCRSIAAC